MNDPHTLVANFVAALLGNDKEAEGRAVMAMVEYMEQSGQASSQAGKGGDQ